MVDVLHGSVAIVGLCAVVLVGWKVRYFWRASRRMAGGPTRRLTRAIAVDVASEFYTFGVALFFTASRLFDYYGLLPEAVLAAINLTIYLAGSATTVLLAVTIRGIERGE